MALTRMQVMLDFMVGASSRKPPDFEGGDLSNAS
jgi:hypothetical protein